MGATGCGSGVGWGGWWDWVGGTARREQALVCQAYQVWWRPRASSFAPSKPHTSPYLPSHLPTPPPQTPLPPHPCRLSAARSGLALQGGLHLLALLQPEPPACALEGIANWEGWAAVLEGLPRQPHG